MEDGVFSIKKTMINGRVEYQVCINGSPIDGYADEKYARHMCWLLKFLEHLNKLNIELDEAMIKGDLERIKERRAGMDESLAQYSPFLGTLTLEGQGR